MAYVVEVAAAAIPFVAGAEEAVGGDLQKGSAAY